MIPGKQPSSMLLALTRRRRGERAGRGAGAAPTGRGMEACGESAGVRQLRAAAADLVFGCGTSLELPFETCCLAALILQRFACTCPFDAFDPDISECCAGARRKAGGVRHGGQAPARSFYCFAPPRFARGAPLQWPGRVSFALARRRTSLVRTSMSLGLCGRPKRQAPALQRRLWRLQAGSPRG